MSLDEPTKPEGEKPRPFTSEQFSVFALLERMTFQETIDVFGFALRKYHRRTYIIQYISEDEHEDTLDPVPVSLEDVFHDEGDEDGNR